MPLPFLLYFDFLFPSLFYFHILIKYEFPFGLVLWCESSFRYFFLLGSKIMSTLNTEDIKYNQVIRHIYLPFSHKSSSKQAFRNRPFLSPFPKNSLPPVFILAVGHLQREAMLVQQLAWMQWAHIQRFPLSFNVLKTWCTHMRREKILGYEADMCNRLGCMITRQNHVWSDLNRVSSSVKK